MELFYLLMSGVVAAVAKRLIDIKSTQMETGIIQPQGGDDPDPPPPPPDPPDPNC